MSWLFNILLVLGLIAEIGGGAYLNYIKYQDLTDAKSRITELQQKKADYEREIKELEELKEQNNG